MFSYFIYPVLGIMFVLCLGIIMLLHKRGVSNNKIVMTAGMLGIATFLFQYFPPPWYLLVDYENAYLPAGAAAMSDHTALSGLLAKGVLGFVNLPIVAFLFSPFAALPFAVGEALFLGIGVVAALLLWRELVRLLDLNTRESALLLFLVLGSGPAAYNLFLGNTSQIVMVLIILGLGAFMQRRDTSAGILFALAALIKPALIIFGIYALLRGRWKVALSGGVVCVAATLLSIIIFGWPMHVLWLEQTILPALDGTIMAYNVQSISAVVSRAMVGSEHLLDWTPTEVPELASLISRILQLAALAVIVTCITLLARLKRTAETAPLEVSFVLMIPLLIPNLAWNHYLIWAFLPLALCLRGLPGFGQMTRLHMTALVAMALIILPIETWTFSSPLVQEVFGRVIVSLPFLGVVLLLILMVQMTLSIRNGTSDTGLIAGNVRGTAFSPKLKVPFTAHA